ncbi:MAG: DNA polymerase III subunit alpha [Thermodesulfobacteria bacterium]|nr:DNA polymerase III subunit alpha [Thermodesulfobacteriota bacterium]
MAETSFTHLHLHTEFSLLDGAIRLKDLFPRAKEYGYDSVAITDHGNMYGVLKFYQGAQKAGIKPIIGCEVYVAPGSRHDRSAKSQSEAAYHLVLLAMNQTGYKNLMKLVTLANFEGFYYKPRVDKEILQQFNEGLIALSACLHGEVSHALLLGNEKKAQALAETYASIFKDRFYLELQENSIPEQTNVNQGLVELSRKLGIPLVATNDCHYLNREDADAHDVLLCIQTGKTVNDSKRMKFSTDTLFFTPPEEMEKRFQWCPEALAATKEIAERCNVEIETGKHHFPLFQIDPGTTYEEEFERQARKGFEKRKKQLDLGPEELKVYESRLEEELEIIKDKGFASYFLIVADFINWAKDHGIPVGPGRGSAAGSLVAYSMGITDIDPVRYGLFFERFLNVERVSLPDIDVDFCMAKRDEVIRYVTEKYGGEDFVAQIITFGQMKAKAVIRDVGRGLGMTYQDVDKIAKLVPDKLNISLEEAIKLEPKLKELSQKDEQIKRLLTVARALEGLPRHSSTHAAGVVISDKPMVEYLPLTKGQEGETVTQFDMKDVEKVGLIKFDFLGLKTLTVLDTAVKLVKKHYGEDIDLSSIPLDDPKTFELLQKGDTTGVFQLESSGMKNLIRQLKPTTFTDLIALVALYRPGPLESGMVSDFVKRKHGQVEVKYLLPQLEPILKETYGVIVYQEQVMKIAQELAGYSLGEGDLLRRAMGKKIPEVMEAQKDRFMKGALEKGIDKEKAETIFDLMAKFAGYGFNKSHSAAYALISYQTAWLKAHYRIPYMTSLLSNELGNTDGVVKFLAECRSSSIEVLPPDINKSEEDFSIEDEKIRFGLAAVKNVGTSAIRVIIREREEHGPFKDFMDFVSRVDLKKVNKRVLESLIKSGALDCFGLKRAQLFESIDAALDYGHKKQREKSLGQKSLFDCAPLAGEATAAFKIPDVEEWDELERLSKEKEALGFYISGHPLDTFRDDLARLSTLDTDRLPGVPEGSRVYVAGIVRSKKDKLTKKGTKMSFLVLEDLTGSIEVICFPEVYSRCKEIIEGDRPIFVEGLLKKEGEDQEELSCKIIAEKIDYLQDICTRRTCGVIIELKEEQVGRAAVGQLRDVLKQNPGELPVTLTVRINNKGVVHLSLPDEFNVRMDEALADGVQQVLGYPALRAEYDTQDMVHE